MSTPSTKVALSDDPKHKPSHVIKTALKVLMAVLILIAVLAGVVMAYLAYPGTPARSSVMSFEGFIQLPRSRILTILDYLTITGRTLFVTNISSGSVYKIELNSTHLPSSTVTEMRGAGEAHGVAVLPDGKTAFATHSETNTVDVFNPDSLQRLRSIPVADDADGIHYLPAANLVYVASGDAKMATLIDPQNRETVGTISLPGKPEFAALDPQTGLLYQNLEDTDLIVAIDLGKRSIAGQWPLTPCEGPSGMAIDPKQRRLFSVCFGNATFVVFDLDTHRVLTSLKTGGRPDSVAFDPVFHRIYVAALAGTLTVIQQDGPDAYRVLDQIRTHVGAHTLAVDPFSHKVYVAYASLFTNPRIAVFSPAR